MAEQESSRKSSSVIWGFERRKEAGFYLTPTHNLLGYDKTKEFNKDDREIIIIEEEANTVRLIFYMFLAGFRVSEIAHTLTNAGVATSKGNTVWNSGSVLGILKNERYAGDVRTNKTYHDFEKHHTYKNTGERSFVYETDHHVPIVSHEVYEMAQKLIASHKYGYDPFINCTYSPSIIEKGLLQGFIPINIHWAGSNLEEYIQLAKTAPQTQSLLEQGIRVRYFPGCEVVRPHDVSHTKKCALRFTPSAMGLNANCLGIFDSDYIEILFNPIDRLIAIRQTESQMPGAVRWRKQKDGKRFPCMIGSAAFTKIVYELMEWPMLWNTSVMAQIYTDKNSTVMLFDLTQYEINALPYPIPKKEKKKKNDDIYYDIELMIAQQIELLQQKRMEALNINNPEEEKEDELPRPKRKRLHPGEWIHSFGERSEVAAVQYRRYQAESLDDWELDSEATIHEDFDYRVDITDEMIQEKMSLLQPQKQEDKHE